MGIRYEIVHVLSHYLYDYLSYPGAISEPIRSRPGAGPEAPGGPSSRSREPFPRMGSGPEPRSRGSPEAPPIYHRVIPGPFGLKTSPSLNFGLTPHDQEIQPIPKGICLDSCACQIVQF
jgi:hypothetical protein